MCCLPSFPYGLRQVFSQIFGGGEGGGEGGGGEGLGGGGDGDGGVEGGRERNVTVPTQSALPGAKMTRPSLAVVAPANFLAILMVDEMSTQLKVLSIGSKMPTQSVSDGAKTTRPSLTVVTPWNLSRPYCIAKRMLTLDEMSTQLKLLSVGSKMPTQLALAGAKTTSRLLTIVAPRK